jgi:nucleoside-diphosphate kinase
LVAQALACAPVATPRPVGVSKAKVAIWWRRHSYRLHFNHLEDSSVALERTFAIIKPDAVGRNLQGEILSRIHKAGFKIVAIKSMRLTKEEAGGFYAVHKERPFFGELTNFMCSGKIFAMVLEADGAISQWRDTMGATDPKKAAPGTIRNDLGTSIGNNCVHGSDAPDTAAFEIGYFFSALELI